MGATCMGWDGYCCHACVLCVVFRNPLRPLAYSQANVVNDMTWQCLSLSQFANLSRCPLIPWLGRPNDSPVAKPSARVHTNTRLDWMLTHSISFLFFSFLFFSFLSFSFLFFSFLFFSFLFFYTTSQDIKHAWWNKDINKHALTTELSNLSFPFPLDLPSVIGSEAEEEVGIHLVIRVSGLVIK